MISKDDLEIEKNLLQDLLYGAMESEGYEITPKPLTESSKRYNLKSPYSDLNISVQIIVKNEVS